MKWEKIQFATPEEVIEIHEAALQAAGGTPGIRDRAGLESAVMASQATFGGEPLLRSLADIAAAYVFYISRSHAFVDGNKRAAIAVALGFLSVNGFTLVLDDEDEELDWATTVEQVAKGTRSRENLAEIFASAMGNWGEFE
jgi:death-on-curing protein